MLRIAPVEASEGLLGSFVHVQNLPGAYKIGGVGPVGRGGTGIVADDMVREAGVVELFVELSTELVQVAEVEGAEIEVEVIVLELIVNGKVVNGTRFWLTCRGVGYHRGRVA